MRDYRKLLCTLIEKFTSQGIGLEIGIKTGGASADILTHTNTQHLYMVDPWKRNFSKTQKLYSKKRDPEDDYQFVIKKFAKLFSDRSTIIRKKSEDAIKDVPGKLDFIFIDGNHEYEYVMRDLLLWTPKIRKGGLVVGHDWWSNFPGVIRAVIDFCQTDSFVHINELERIDQFRPAPSNDPVIMKSWPNGQLWWSIKK